MAIITIFSASYCRESEIVKILSDKLGYNIIDSQLIEETSKKYGVSIKKLNATLHGQVSFINNVSHEREKNSAYLKSTLAELIRCDNIIHSGWAGHLMPSNIAHILKVCLVGNKEYRVKVAMESDNLNENDALHRIMKDDENRNSWVQYLHNSTPYDKSLYDIVIPVNTMTTQEIVELVLENVRKKPVQTTKISQKAMDDFCLSAKINVPLVENGYDVFVKSDDGNVNISLKKFIIRFESVKDKIIKLVSPLQGVKNVEVVMGPDVTVDTRFDELKAHIPFLLVDDEKEYIQTLSQRLQVREVESVIAYDGEEALSYIEKDEPDVMVLDLKMPGIDGMEVLRKVKKERPHVEVIILTGHGSERDRKSAMDLGAFAYLEKPVDIEVLTNIMKEAYQKIEREK